MKPFRIAVVRPVSAEPKEKTLFIVLRDSTFIVGRSITHQQLWNQYCCETQQVDGMGSEQFAEGSCEDGRVIFADSTPGWKRDEIREFLAGLALQTIIASQQRSDRMATTLFRAAEKAAQEHDA